MTPAAMAVLHARCFTTPRPWTAAEFADLLAEPPVFAVTVPLGFALGRVVADEAELLTIAVAPEVRRQGAGQALMTAFARTSVVRGAATAFLEVAADNAAALALYRRSGFAEAGRRRGYYHLAGNPPVDALVMVKSLDAQGDAS